MTDEAFELTDDMSPSVQETLELLKAGGFVREKHGFGASDLLTQLNAVTGAVWPNRATLVRKGYPETEKKLRFAHRLAQASGVLGAARIEKSVATQVATQDQAEPRQVLIRTRDAAKQLMKDAGHKVDHFPVKFPAGDANALVGPAATLVDLLDKFQEKLANPILGSELLADARAAAQALRLAETRQEVGKVEQTVPTSVKQAASEALYGLLLHFSRAGGAVFRHEPEVAATFQLNALFRRTGAAAEQGLDPVTEGDGDEGGGDTPAATTPVTKPSNGTAPPNG